MASYSTYLANQNFDLALREIDILLKEDDYNIELLEIKANVLSKLKDYSKSLDIYNRLINLIPRTADYYAQRGLVLHFLDKKIESLADFTAAIELEPDNGYRYSSRAFIKDYQGDQEGALVDYNKAIALDPNDAVSLNNKGLIEEKLGRMHIAQQSFKKADNLAGILPQQEDKQYSEKFEPSVKSKKLSLSYLITIIKQLFISKEERQRFINFILRK